MTPAAALRGLGVVAALMLIGYGGWITGFWKSAPPYHGPSGRCVEWIADAQPTIVCTDGHAWKMRGHGWQDLGIVKPHPPGVNQ